MAVLFSAVTLTADNNQVEFLAAGIPRDSDDLEGWTAYENFMDELDSEQEVSVHVEAYLYGEGETFKATPEEVAYFKMRADADEDFLHDHPYTVAENGNRKVQYANKAELMDGIVRKYHPEALLEGDITGGGGEMEEPKQTEAKNHQPPKSNRSRSRQPKPLPEQTEKDGKKGGSLPSQKQVTVEPGPETVPLEASDGQA